MIATDHSRTISDVPRLTVRQTVKAQAHITSFRYRAKHHASLPHVVKFSGGRSSAMLLFVLLDNDLLDRDRGDVIVFNNTSAEHPATYRFVRDCMTAAERYGIPFFQTEFQTYEAQRAGEWTRKPTYRIVNPQPKSDTNPDGFHWHGEVFEELLSWRGYVPNNFNRICTSQLKLEVTRSFLKDWLTAQPGLTRLGHDGDSPRIDPDVAYARHQKNRGGVPKDIFIRKRAYAWHRPHVRPAQTYADYAPNWRAFDNPTLNTTTLGDRAVFGRDGLQYVALIGLRADENHRVQRVRDRNDTTKGYEGEHVYMPLAEMSASREDVNAFWAQQAFDLELPADASLSNCVYCFLKGAGNLRDVHTRLTTGADDEFDSLKDTPSDLNWWTRLEQTYGRDLIAEGRPTRTDVTHIGFFGNRKFSYRDVGNGADIRAFTESILPCDCTE